jgi:hypothetical protein
MNKPLTALMLCCAFLVLFNGSITSAGAAWAYDSGIVAALNASGVWLDSVWLFFYD